ncbi:MAG: hypothetical protein H6736_13070 [Alphaproteobacteria bacterium]|nr:hypothetical protein [Alphaproteobacteria bacterium]MCB9692735.1 hypothetical protein [Alphaproteobacteria bacterium]
MAIRVRKLAKRLGRTPVEVLGVLHAIGIDRYRSPEDMLSDVIEQKLVHALKTGVKPVRFEPEAVRREATQREPEAAPGLFRDVKRTTDPRYETLDDARQPAAPQRPPPPVVQPQVEPQSRPEPVVAPAAPRVDPDVLAAEREALRAEREALAAAREALQAERALLEAARSRAPEPTPLAEVLAGRGLMGADESERAIRALAESRRIAEVLPYLRVEDAEGLHRYLRDVLLLVDGKPPEGVSGAMVSVSPDRSEVPGAAEWRRLTGKVSEALMLLGARRVLVVGGPVRMHRLLANAFDPRIEVRFRPTDRVHPVDAEADVGRTDAVVLWCVDVDAEADRIYGTGRAHVTRVDRPSVRTMLETWARDLGEA